MIFKPEQLSRYSRHFVLPQVGVAGQKKLLSAKVLVIGAGALGSSALMYLAAAGVGTIGIADCDTVDISNLQRQIIHTTSSVGKSKVLSAAETIKELNPDIDIIPYKELITADNIMEIIKDYDFLIDGSDNFETKFLINDACVLANKPYSHAGAVRFGGQTFTYVPGKGPCLRCMLGTVPSSDDTCSCSSAGIIGAVTGIIGSIQALEAIKYILGTGELLCNRILTFNGLKMDLRTVSVQPDPDCMICGTSPTVHSLNDRRSDYEQNCSIRKDK